MAEEVENHTLRLLQEMRAEMKGQGERLGGIAAEMADMRADLTNRLDGNTLLLNLIAGMPHNHEERIQKLERSGA